MHTHLPQALNRRVGKGLAWSLLAALAALTATTATAAASPTATGKESLVTRHATGPFDVKVAPQPLAGPTEDPTLGRFSLEKTYHGDLEATAGGQMLTAGTEVKGSAAYVAVERVSGKLAGRAGSFALMHHATMGHGEQHMEITVVPDSGTGDLVGLAGTLNIIIAEGGKHSYDLEYTLPPAQ